MLVDPERCNGCWLCVEACCLGAVSRGQERPAVSRELCVNSLACPAQQICPTDALVSERVEPAGAALPHGFAECAVCPSYCQIPPGGSGDCRMNDNRDGRVVRAVALTSIEDAGYASGGEAHDAAIANPLVSGIGAGTRMGFGCPYVVQGNVDGVDVVTCVTESHYMYSGIQVKIDAEPYIGEEGAPIIYKGVQVGMVSVEEYGSKWIYIGGASNLSRKNGWMAARLVADIANRQPVKMKVRGGARLELQVGEKPVINGEVCDKRRWACGGDAAFELSIRLQEPMAAGVVDEIVVFDRSYLGHAGPAAEQTQRLFDDRKKSGLKLKFAGPHTWCVGPRPTAVGGWGGTFAKDPLEIIEAVDPTRMKAGFTLLFVEADGRRRALYRWRGDGNWTAIDIPRAVATVLDRFHADCEPARVSAYFVAGAGGAARRGVSPFTPRKVVELVERSKLRLTCGGAPTLRFPGGGIGFMVDVETVKPGAFYWTPIPAVVAPLEWTMRRADFEAVGGRVDEIRDVRGLAGERRDD